MDFNCVTQSSKAVWIGKSWTYNGRVLLSGPNVNGRALLRPLRVLFYSGRVPSGPRGSLSPPLAPTHPLSPPLAPRSIPMNVIVQGGLVDLIPMNVIVQEGLVDLIAMNVIVQGGVVDLIAMNVIVQGGLVDFDANECNGSRGAG